MVATAAGPLAIFAGVSLVVGLLLLTFRETIGKRFGALSASLPSRIDRAGLSIKPDDLLLTAGAVAVVAWIAAVLLLHPSILVGMLILPLVGALAIGGLTGFLSFKEASRQKAFMPQLELSLRMIAGALRVGLGLRQAMILVTEELEDPARSEFLRVVGRTNIGVGVLDALDEFAARMPSNEMRMTVGSIRVQAQTGGDLAKVLENVANTIKGRRAVVRKMRALTAEGRMSAYIIVALPLVVGGFIVGTQAQMGHALLYTFVGHLTLLAVAGLEIAAALILKQIMRFDV